jgi:hypothetical protein
MARTVVTAPHLSRFHTPSVAKRLLVDELGSTVADRLTSAIWVTGIVATKRSFRGLRCANRIRGCNIAERCCANAARVSQKIKMRMIAFLFAILTVAPLFAAAPSVPPAIFTDPPADHAHPAAMTVIHVPSHGVQINGVLYSPAGPGPHPTLVICHGLPGNEKNLDLAQAIRRAGWNAVTFNYRGSWGSPGVFRFAQNVDDAASVLAYLRDPANAAALGVDANHIAIAGHSMGGWVTAHTAARDHSLMGAIMISTGDVGRLEE